MRQMKDSGVKWIGEIPTDWDITILSALFQEQKQKNIGLTENNLLSLSYGKIIKKNIDSNEGLLPASFESYNVINAGNIIFRLTDLQNDKRSLRTGLCQERGIITSAYVALSIRSEDDPSYMHYLFHIYDICKVFYGMGDGVRQGMNYSDLKRLRVIRPPLETQRRIATDLDEKCAKIDTIIDKQQEVIEKLKEYKLSVITEAVTKGLDPDVPMKDSGSGVMGDIPAHWKMVRLKFLMTHIIDCPHETPNYTADGDYLVIRTADQDYGFLRPDADMYRLNVEEYSNRIRRLPLNQDDIVYGREGERWGLACLVPQSDRYCLGQRMMQFRCNTNLVLPQYAMWALNSKYVYLQGSVDTIGSTSPHVNISTMRNYSIPIPPIEEQQAILTAINDKVTAFQKSIIAREKLINRLNEYKKSLIYEVVTGKREV